MKPKWPKLASLAQQFALSSFSSLVNSLLLKDNFFKNIFDGMHQGNMEIRNC